MNNIDSLMKNINYKFKNISNLNEALTHSSFNSSAKIHNYERLEFLGDRVLGLIIASKLYFQNIQSSEGDLAKKLSFLVCKSTLKKIANEIELEKYVKHSKKVDSLESIKANALEALIGAIYLDSNLEKTTTVILSLWKNYFDNINLSSFDPKSSLQEWCLKYKKKLPEYKLIEKIGPDHQPTFKIKVFIDNHTYSSANGNSKQDAEINAAEKLLKKISEKKEIE
jgi:ribonuclease-3